MVLGFICWLFNTTKQCIQVQILHLPLLSTTFAGIYADNQKLMSVVNSKVVKAPPEMASKEMYEKVIDNPVGITVKMVIVFPRVPMSMVRNNFNEGIGVAIRKLGGGNNNDLTKRLVC